MWLAALMISFLFSMLRDIKLGLQIMRYEVAVIEFMFVVSVGVSRLIIVGKAVRLNTRN